MTWIAAWNNIDQSYKNVKQKKADTPKNTHRKILFPWNYKQNY